MDEVREIIEARKAIHGDFSEGARIIQNLKYSARDGVNYHDLSAVQNEALDMILHKIGRILAGDPNHRDHWDDIAGYATLAADRCKAKEHD